MIQKNPQIAEQEIADSLAAYKQVHPGAETKSYRYSSGSIRIRIIDPRFEEMGRIERNDDFWDHLQALTDDSFSQISMVVLLAPSEADSSMANYEFDHPNLSTL